MRGEKASHCMACTAWLGSFRAAAVPTVQSFREASVSVVVRREDDHLMAAARKLGGGVHHEALCPAWWDRGG